MSKYILWVDYGSEGWSRYNYDTLEECMKHESYGGEKVITKLVEYDIKERE